MKKMANILICAFVVKCLYAFQTETATIADGIFLIASVLYVLVFIIKLKVPSPGTEEN